MILYKRRGFAAFLKCSAALYAPIVSICWLSCRAVQCRYERQKGDVQNSKILVCIASWVSLCFARNQEGDAQRGTRSPTAGRAPGADKRGHPRTDEHVPNLDTPSKGAACGEPPIPAEPPAPPVGCLTGWATFAGSGWSTRAKCFTIPPRQSRATTVNSGCRPVQSPPSQTRCRVPSPPHCQIRSLFVCSLRP